MYISKIQIHNYKGYYDSSPLELTTGFNIITGQNNAGKTALLEALSLNFPVKPNRTFQSLRTSSKQMNIASSVDVSFTLSREELFEILVSDFNEVYIPLPTPMGTAFNESIGYIPAHEGSLEILRDWVFSHEFFTFEMQREASDSNKFWHPIKYPSFGLYESASDKDRGSFASYKVNSDKTLSAIGSGEADITTADFGYKIVRLLHPRIYSFNAERFNLGTSSVGASNILRPNAENLAEVLNTLQANTNQFRRFNELIREILPQIRGVSVHLIEREQKEFEILTWIGETNSEQEEFPVPLSDSGTGIGQVLAILYVVFTSKYPRAFLIDEPNSFLHPGAARKLIEVLKKHPQHQYIISTHSPTILTAALPATITMVKKQNRKITHDLINAKETKQLRVYLAEIGARLSDVFGADNILWVEGATEEVCFPMILERLANRRLMGTAIVGVRNTGDFEGRHAETVIEIYERISKSSSILPPAIGFIFDKECRTEEQQKDLKRRNASIFFIPRRLYENYLLDTEAITAIVNTIDGFSEQPIRESDVEDWLDNNRDSKKYMCRGAVGSSDSWYMYIDGAGILEDIFSNLSEGRVMFIKTEHSIALTEWLLKNKPENLSEIAEILISVLDRSNAIEQNA
jgi:AAA15 family ATPase/GTPase